MNAPPLPDIARDLAALVAAVERADTASDLLRATRRLAAAAHPETAPCLVEVLGFNNPGAAVAAVDGLVAIGEAAVTPLLANIDQHNYGARAWAVRALAGIGSVRGLAVLEEALGTDIGPSVRRAAARGLGQLRLEALEASEREAVRRRCLAALLAGCRDGEWVVRYAVAVGLEQLLLDRAMDPQARRQGLEGLDALTRAEQEEAAVVRLRARQAMARLET